MATPSRWPTNNPVKWADLLGALSKKDHIPEWPLLSTMIANLNCETCSLQFVSSINYRRHMLTHNRTSNLDKELVGNKDLLQKYWDSMSSNDFNDVVSFKDVTIKDESGYAIFQQLESFIKKPRVVLPGAYIKAGTLLVSAVKSRPTKRPTSEELFRILNDASEQTFLCSVIEDSVRTYVFDGDSKISHENLVACICFLLEEKLVKYWNVHKAFESLLNEEDNPKERQAKPSAKKKKKKQKRNEKKTQKQFEEPQSTEGGDEDASKCPTEKSNSAYRPSDLDFRTQVAQPGQLSEAAMPSDAEDVNGGHGQKKKRSDEEIKEDKVCAESGQEEGGDEDASKCPTETFTSTSRPSDAMPLDAEKGVNGGHGQKEQRSNEEIKEDKVCAEFGQKEGGDDDASMCPTETSTSASRTPDEDFRTQVAQPEQLSEAALPLDAEKDVNGGHVQKERRSKEEIKEDKVCAEFSKKEGGADDASKCLTETSTRASHTSDEDFHTQVAQPEQLSEAAMPFDAEKDVNGGHGLKEQRSNEEIKEDKVCAELSQKDAEPRQKEQEAKELQTRQAKQIYESMTKTQRRRARQKIYDKKCREGNLGDTSDALPPTGTSIPDTPHAVGSQTLVPLAQLDPFPDASQIRYAEKDGECKQKEERSMEQRSQDKQFQVMIDTSTKVKQGDNFPAAIQVCDAEKEDGGLKQKAEMEKEQISEDVKNASDILYSGEILSSSVPSENPIDTQVTQPDQSPSHLKPAILSDAEKTADAECSQEEGGRFLNDAISTNPASASHGSEDKGIVTHDNIDQGKHQEKAAKVVQFQPPDPDQHKYGSAASVGTHHGIAKGKAIIDFDQGGSHGSVRNEFNEDSSPIAPLADDPDNIIRVKEDLGRAWELMLSKLNQLSRRQLSRHLTIQPRE